MIFSQIQHSRVAPLHMTTVIFLFYGRFRAARNTLQVRLAVTPETAGFSESHRKLNVGQHIQFQCSEAWDVPLYQTAPSDIDNGAVLLIWRYEPPLRHKVIYRF